MLSYKNKALHQRPHHRIRHQRTRPTWLSVVAVACAVLATAPAEAFVEPDPSAGDDGVVDITELSLEDLLNEGIQTGSFLEIDLRHSPVSLTIITRPQIQASGARHLSELVEIYVPGFQIIHNKWGGIVWGMRGVAADRNTKILFLVNGLKLNHESRDGFVSELSLGMLGDIERVEVLRGPAGLTYGSGAIAGVINVVTRQPEQSRAEVGAWIDTWLGAGAEALSAHRYGEDHVLVMSGGFRRSQGLSDAKIYGDNSWPNDGVPSPNGVKSNGSPWQTDGNWRASLDWQWKRLRVYARFTHQEHPTSGFFIDHDLIPAQDTQDLDRRVQIVDNASVQASYAIPIDEDELQMTAAWIGATNRLRVDAQPRFMTPDTLTRARGDALRDSFGERRYLLEARYLLKRVEKLQATAGVMYRLDDLGDDLEGYNMSDYLSTKPAIASVLYHTLSFYTEAAYRPWEPLTLFVGARVDKHTRTPWVISPKGAAVIDLHEDHLLKLIVQGSSNNGSVDNYEYNRNHFNNDGTVTVGPGSSVPTREELHTLKPEQVISYEVTTTHQLFGKRLLLMPSVTYSQISDLFVWNQGQQRVVNAGAYDVLSVEGEVRFDEADVVQVGVSHGFQRPFRINNTQQDAALQSLTETVSRDGSAFLNLNTHVTKLFADYHALPWLLLHTDMRIFWGLDGRADLYAEDTAKGESYLNADSKPSIKLNVSLLIDLPWQMRLSLYGYDLLGSIDSVHAVRWQQMAEPSQREVFTVDQRQFGFRIDQRF
jgi:outer membrane receptor protein involved in Fe transport